MKGLFLLIALAGVTLMSNAQGTRLTEAHWETWGKETLDIIRSDLWISSKSLYADKSPGTQPAFMWGCGVMLSALNAAAKVSPTNYIPHLKQYADALDVYWIRANSIYGFNVLPAPSPPDRYYDDNAWMVLAYLETYEITKEVKYLNRAKQAFEFVFSGEDNQLGGGIYWHENNRNSKNTASCGPAVAGALRLHQLTGEQRYLDAGLRVYQWTKLKLQDSDALFWDNIRMNGAIDKTKWSYNSALMLRSSVLLYQITGQTSYLDEAKRIANAAANRWVRTSDGALTDEGRFAHLLSEAFLALYQVDKNERWLTIVKNGLKYLHDKVRDSRGHYPKRWDTPPTAALTSFEILDQASAARAYWELAESFQLKASTPKRLK